MKALGTGILAFAVAGLLTAPTVSAKTTPVDQSNTAAQSDDQILTQRIDTRLEANTALKRYDIDVAVKEGVATLTGSVRTEAERLRAGRDAHVPGVTRVENKITLDKNAGAVSATADKVADKTKQGLATAADKTKEGVAVAADKTKEGVAIAVDKTKEGLGTAADKTKEGLGTAADKTKSAVETAGDKTAAGVSKTGEVISDAWITTKLHGKFIGEDLLKDSKIDVDTKDRVVTLKGTVKTEAGRSRAIAIVKGSEGVSKVVDQLTIK
jgi:osmotically-inducible protein OsmY